MLDRIESSSIIIQPSSNQPQKKNLAEDTMFAANEKIGATQPDKMEKIIEGMNDFLQPSATHIQFEYHDKLQEYYVAVVDNVTQEVVREIPPKKMLDIYAAMAEFLGVLVDKKI